MARFDRLVWTTGVCLGVGASGFAGIPEDAFANDTISFGGANQPAYRSQPRHRANIQNGCLHITGTGADTALGLRLRAGDPSILEVDVGNEGRADFRFSRDQFDSIEVDARGGDDVVLIDEVNGVFTDTEITTIYGGYGNDKFFGGSGAETFVGGPGNDAGFLGAGSDRFVWNSGDATDLVEGSDDVDTIEVNGSHIAEDFTITANGSRVRFDRIDPVPFFLDLGGCEQLILNAQGGDDTLACTGNLAALIRITADGGPGADTLLGSNGADVLLGGDDDDFVDGNQGTDTVLLGAGDDLFQWDPGDGNDTVEGQEDLDTLSFNGSNIGEIVEFSANGSRLRFTRNIGNIVLDADGIEEFGLRTFGGADAIHINDLTGTALTQVNVDLAANNGTGDAQADAVVLVGTQGADVFNISADAGFVVVDGSAEVRVKGYEAGDEVVFIGGGGDLVNVNGTAGPDSMTVTANGTQARVDVTDFSAAVAVSGALSLAVNGRDGDDIISCTGNLAGLSIPLTLDGGSGADRLFGSNGADLLLGGDDDDFVDGNQGADTALLGAGDDIFQWDPGDGNDTVEGQEDLDTLSFNGSNIGEILEFSANGARLRFTRNIANIVLDADGIEEFDLRTLGGADAIHINDLTGTALTQVKLDLAASGGGGDAQPDAVVLVGSSGVDQFDISADAGAVIADLSVVVRVLGYEASDEIVINGVGGDLVHVNGSSEPDTMTVTANGTQARVDATGFSAAVSVGGVLALAINGQSGDDTISCTGNLAGLSIPLTLDGGPGADRLFGSNGADLLLGGDDDDFVDGNQGADTALLGAGDDVFQWDPGDGNDTVEGQEDVDALSFNGSNIGEILEFSANGARLRLTRNIANIVLDADGIEEFGLRTFGGADAIHINDLTGTALTLVHIDLAPNGGGGDGQADGVTVNGTEFADTIDVTAIADVVEVLGLAALVRINNAEQANDILVVNGLDGVDSMTADTNVDDLIRVILNQ